MTSIKINHISSLNEPFPSPTALDAATTTHHQGTFAISTRKLPILKSAPIDAMQERLGIPIPEMIFGDNLVSITHKPTGWSIEFNAEDALDRVDKTGEKMLRVAYAGEWSSSREKTSAGISEVVKPFDWSYTTDYCGTEKPGAKDVKLHGDEHTPDIPIELLKRRDPILFNDEVVLYESELDDNGISIVSVKLRVMEHRMLLLCRMFMRLDNVLVRVRDTRVYVDFDKEEVIREYTEREDKFENVKTKLFMQGLKFDQVTIALRDANQVAPLLPLIKQGVESVILGPGLPATSTTTSRFPGQTQFPPQTQFVRPPPR
ncbi:TIP41-like family-domain-containing protein [Sordaria brevicollis]|uniref:TIP41-like family-domain-containing protein n=1 Tax=Sordaria brevicollis TaxID=83679 RepID=A0AAE0U5J3_SORBR|nr:TIP41-like family-domain-containing protein [Sordaria brevicollis]